MKLRIKGNSLRLRVSHSELVRILNGGRVTETIRFAPAQEAMLTYALDSAQQPSAITVQYKPQELTVTLSRDQAAIWGSDGEIGVHGTVNIGAEGVLEVIVEKDFACLDRSDEENLDAFPNPHA